MIDPKLTRLKSLLAAKKWGSAEIETNNTIKRLVGYKKQSNIPPELIKKMPCKDLHNINQLWVSSTPKPHFGYSVQLDIWESPPINKSFQRFGNATGWQKNGKWLEVLQLSFSVNNPTGHLPWHGWQYNKNYEFKRIGFGLFMERLKQCKI
uniref:GUN4 domain protein n=1 Tax=Cyanothece sp. (strain PCC 7425 / ATCC 29141) TaxID=395961 RepID=B8HYT4_CYAP4